MKILLESPVLWLYNPLPKSVENPMNKTFIGNWIKSKKNHYEYYNSLNSKQSYDEDYDEAGGSLKISCLSI